MSSSDVHMSSSVSQSTNLLPGVIAPEMNEALVTAGKQFYNEHQRKLYLTWRQQGRAGLVIKIMEMDQAEKAAKVFKDIPPTLTQSTIRLGEIHCLTILMTLPDELIEALILGQVIRNFTQPAQRNKLGVKTVASEATPSKCPLFPDIYGNFLCNLQGQSLSYDQLMRLLDTVDRYAHGLTSQGPAANTPPAIPTQTHAEGSWAYKIENIIGTGRPSGWNKNTTLRPTKAERRYIRKDVHVTQLREWSARIRQYAVDWRQNNPSANTTDPLPWTLSETGWAFRQGNRRRDHETHTNSIWIMNLVDAIARWLFDHKFKTRFIALCRVPFEPLVPVAEHVVSRLAGSYYVHHGFNFAVGGITTGSRHKIPEATWDKVQGEMDAAYASRVQADRIQLNYRKKFLEQSAAVAKLEEEFVAKRKARQDLSKERQKAQKEEEDAYSEIEQVWLAYVAQDRVKRAMALQSDLAWMEGLKDDLEELKLASPQP